MLFSATGMMLLASATELITIYISLELTTLPLAALAAFLMTSKSSEAAMKFLIIGAISSAVMLYGMALVYGLSGGTTIQEIAAFFRGLGRPRSRLRRLCPVDWCGADAGWIRLQDFLGALPDVGAGYL